ncbi:hypothetical protein IQ07DRAFT_676820 [Pyrenochaeta sp. DS3sAY3a]|nr:hypothetical protein IQ07DRAFT_676820 [Pyrenochaeta sp. DS3sAY3a]
MAYKYAPLRALPIIRLIKVLPDKQDNKVVCILSHFDQAEAPPYTALSYRWGDSAPAGSIFLGNDAENVHLHPLHASLLAFLGCMWEQRNFETLFWTDSLCLNQSDIEEKAQQVPRMGDIYASAAVVVVWLGCEPQGEENMRIVRDWPSQADFWGLEVSSDTGIMGFWSPRKKGRIPRDETWSRFRQAAKYFLDLTYWRRIWIVQEVVLSRRPVVTCGSVSLAFDSFRAKMNHFRHDSAANPFIPFWSLCELRDLGRKMPLWRLLRDFRLSESSLLVDKVFGLFGLVEQADSDTWVVDYAMAPLEVFWDAVLECHAPWYQYNHTINELEPLVRGPGSRWLDDGVRRLDAHLADLRTYVKCSRTSGRHAICAEIIARAAQAGYIYASENGLSDSEWRDAYYKTASGTRLWVMQHRELHNAVAIGLGLSYGAVKPAPGQPWAFHDAGWTCELIPSAVEREGDAGRMMVDVRLRTPVPENLEPSGLEKSGDAIQLRYDANCIQMFAVLSTRAGPGACWTFYLKYKIPTRPRE